MKRIKYLLLSLALICAAGIITMVYNVRTKRASSECLRIEQEIKSSIKIGDEEKKLIKFLDDQRWHYAHDEPLGIYSAQIEVSKSWAGEVHFIKIDARADHGLVQSIEVKDFYRTL